MNWFTSLWNWIAGRRRTIPVRSVHPRTPTRKRIRRAIRPRLVKLRRIREKYRPVIQELSVPQSPYQFSRLSVLGGYLDLSQDGDLEALRTAGLPVFNTPQQLADWLELPLGVLAWLTNRCDPDQRPPDQDRAHYHFVWKPKRSGGHRLIEAPKARLKAAQKKILQLILDCIPPHPASHSFFRGRSIVTNATPHIGKRIVLSCDLENFYTNIRFPQVVAIFRTLGYSREVSLWLGYLTTSAVPYTLKSPSAGELLQYFKRHLPQGAPTSPALANLAAFSLDLRLSGLARKFRLTYTRYADDLTFSGDRTLVHVLRYFVPLVRGIVKSERFRWNTKKTHVVRNNQRQVVTGVVVNQKPNSPRDQYDRLKAILTNCVRRGPSSQNHEGKTYFMEYLRGKIAALNQINSNRGAKLLDLFRQIDWTA